MILSILIGFALGILFTVSGYAHGSFYLTFLGGANVGAALLGVMLVVGK